MSTILDALAKAKRDEEGPEAALGEQLESNLTRTQRRPVILDDSVHELPPQMQGSGTQNERLIKFGLVIVLLCVCVVAITFVLMSISNNGNQPAIAVPRIAALSQNDAIDREHDTMNLQRPSLASAEVQAPQLSSAAPMTKETKSVEKEPTVELPKAAAVPVVPREIESVEEIEEQKTVEVASPPDPVYTPAPIIVEMDFQPTGEPEDLTEPEALKELDIKDEKESNELHSN